MAAEEVLFVEETANKAAVVVYRTETGYLRISETAQVSKMLDWAWPVDPVNLRDIQLARRARDLGIEVKSPAPVYGEEYDYTFEELQELLYALQPVCVETRDGGPYASWAWEGIFGEDHHPVRMLLPNGTIRLVKPWDGGSNAPYPSADASKILPKGLLKEFDEQRRIFDARFAREGDTRKAKVEEELRQRGLL